MHSCGRARRRSAAPRVRSRCCVTPSASRPGSSPLRYWPVTRNLAAKHRLWVVNDEEYLLDFGRSVVHQYDRAISVSGLSKVYGLPALRLGWALGPRDLVERMVNYKRYTTVCNSLVWERAAVEVLAERERHLDRYHTLVAPGVEQLRAFAAHHTDSIRLVEPSGTPFAWLRLRNGLDSQRLAELLLDQERVLVMPAEVFGGSQGIRVSHARKADVLKAGLTRLARLLDSHG